MVSARIRTDNKRYGDSIKFSRAASTEPAHAAGLKAMD